jgi:hypothetical protein
MSPVRKDSDDHDSPHLGIRQGKVRQSTYGRGSNRNISLGNDRACRID